MAGVCEVLYTHHLFVPLGSSSEWWHQPHVTDEETEAASQLVIEVRFILWSLQLLSPDFSHRTDSEEVGALGKDSGGGHGRAESDGRCRAGAGASCSFQGSVGLS